MIPVYSSIRLQVVLWISRVIQEQRDNMCTCELKCGTPHPHPELDLRDSREGTKSKPTCWCKCQRVSETHLFVTPLLQSLYIGVSMGLGHDLVKGQG